MNGLPDGDLAAARAYITHARAYAEQVNARFERFVDGDGDGRSPKVVTARCDEHGHSGKMPALAKAYATPVGLLFVSRISWRPADQGTLQPWMRRALLLGADTTTMDLLMTDDAFLERWRADSADWATGPARVDSGRQRWLVNAGTFEIRDVLDLPDPHGVRPDLWVRCRDHPGAAEKLSLQDLVAALRS